MKYLERIGVGQKWTEPGDITQIQGVHQVVGPGYRDLYQADLLLVDVEAVRLGIDGQDRFIPQVDEHGAKASGPVDPYGWRQ
jgi:hypothetical protein